MCLLEAHAQVRVLHNRQIPSLALLSGKQEEPIGVLSALRPLSLPAQSSVSGCHPSQWIVCLLFERHAIRKQSKARTVTCHKNICSLVFFWCCWNLPMIRSTLLLKYIPSLGDIHFDWRITSTQELSERDDICLYYRLAKESLVMQMLEMPQTDGSVE